MPAQFIQAFTILSDTCVIAFVFFYFLKFRTREKELERREQRIDSQYHQVVDDALQRERKIVDDAVQEADTIISSTKYVSSSTQQLVEQALEKMMADVQKDALHTAQYFTSSYQSVLQQLANRSLKNFHTIAAGMESETQKLVKQFAQAMLPKLEKDLEDYKQERMKETEKLIVQMVNTVSQEVLNKTLPLADHQTLIIESLEKAKKQGIFE